MQCVLSGNVAMSPADLHEFEALTLDGHGHGLQRGEAVFRALRRAIQDGVYRPGGRLREEEVARRLDVSRRPVREALGRLASKGVVVPAPGRSLVVRSLDEAEALELYTMREILEGAAARLAAQHAAAVEIEGLEALERAFARAGSVPEMARLNRLFHEAVVRAARNRFLDGALGEFQDGVALLGPTTFGVAGRPGPAAQTGGRHQSHFGRAASAANAARFGDPPTPRAYQSADRAAGIS